MRTMFREVLGKIEDKVQELKIVPLKEFLDVAWTRRKPTKTSSYFNELMEYIRISHLHITESLPASAMGLTNDQAKSLVQILSTSLHTIIEYGSISDFMVIENARILSRFGAQLPVSWYNGDFVAALLEAVNRFSPLRKGESLGVETATDPDLR
ncbi:hypothetical protein HDU67_004885 [Dinochytrium kinnereticum]|nr:hypothetical protein HDU67_004885 [Dinochytrium kinnereticum]